jgi:Ni,Fe-hydrogenase maturation factor
MAQTKLALLLIQPKDTDFGEGLTSEVQAASEKVERALLELLPK